MAKHKNFKNTYRYNNIYNGLGVLLDEMQRYPFGFKKVYHGTLRDLTDTLMNFFIYKAEREDTGFLIGTPACIKESVLPHTLPMELEPLDSKTSDTRRSV